LLAWLCPSSFCCSAACAINRSIGWLSPRSGNPELEARQMKIL
jgi:hypothetical protein